MINQVVRLGDYQSDFPVTAVRVGGVKAGTFEADKLKEWHWQWNNPTLVPNEGPLRNIYGPNLVKTPLATYLYYFGWQTHGGVNDVHDRIFVARRWGDAWEKIESAVFQPTGAGVAYEDRHRTEEWHTGDPNVIEAYGRYYMFYTSESFGEIQEINGKSVEPIQDTIGVAVSDDLVHWRRAGLLDIDLPGFEGREFAQRQRVDENTVRLHIGIARPCVVWTDDVWRMYFDRPVPHPDTGDVLSKDYPGLARVRSRGVSYAETTDPDFMDWEFKGDLPYAADRSDVDVDVARINGRFFKITASYSNGFFGAVSDDGVHFEWVGPYPGTKDEFKGAMLPPHHSKVFSDYEAHSYDYLTAAPELIHDERTLYGFLYGTSRAPMIHGRIGEVYLQQRVTFEASDGRVFSEALADGYNHLFLKIPKEKGPLEGRFVIYDTDGATLLFQSDTVTIHSGEEYALITE